MSAEGATEVMGRQNPGQEGRRERMLTAQIKSSELGKEGSWGTVFMGGLWPSCLLLRGTLSRTFHGLNPGPACMSSRQTVGLGAAVWERQTSVCPESA